MPSTRHRALRAVLAVAVAASLAPAAASAAVTSSAVTTPAGPVVHPVWDPNAPTFTAVGGTAAGTGDVRAACTFQNAFGNVGANTLSTADATVSAGTFDLQATADAGYHPCRLRALPTGAIPGDLTPFTGPLFLPQHRELYPAGGTGPNAAELRDFYYAFGQANSSTDFDGIASCPLCNMAWVDTSLATPLRAQDTWETGGAFYRFLGNPVERTHALIDGHRSFFTADVGGDLRDDPNYPALTTTFTPTTATTAPSLTERVEPVRCPDDAVTDVVPDQCPALTKTGVRFDRTFTSSADGRWWLLEDVVTSTDGQVHQLDLHYANYLGNASIVGSTAGVAVPWAADPGFTSAGVPRTFGAPASLPASMLVDIDLLTADGDPRAPAGSLTVGPGFVGGSTNAYGNDELLTKFVRTVPAGGSVTISQAFSATPTQAQAQAAAAQAEERIRGPLAPAPPAPPTPVPASLAPPPATATATDTTPPAISGARLSKTAFARGAKGVTFGFRSSEAGSARLVISRRLAGKRKGKACVRPTRTLRRARSCTRLVPVKTITKPVTGGANALAVPTTSPAPGRYTATLTVTDAAGNAAAAVAKTFTVTRPRQRGR